MTQILSWRFIFSQRLDKFLVRQPSREDWKSKHKDVCHYAIWPKIIKGIEKRIKILHPELKVNSSKKNRENE
jgi:hypothetical protein